MHLLLVFFGRDASDDLLLAFRLYRDVCVSSKAVQMSSFSFAVGFVICALAFFLFLFVEKNDQCLSTSLAWSEKVLNCFVIH